jgi:K+-transporting ATPase ATPase C chain
MPEGDLIMRTATQIETDHQPSTIGTDARVRQHPASIEHSVWTTSIRFAVLTAVLLGFAYPLFITGLAQFLFTHQANGSLIVKDSEVVGSELIGQSFTSDRYFHPRPSAAGRGYDATASGGSNLAQSNARLAQRIQADIERLRQTTEARGPVPIDMVTTSASGLDPDITPDNASYQAPRIAASRKVSEEAVRNLINAHVKSRDFGILGEPRVNVLELNLTLDEASSTQTSH